MIFYFFNGISILPYDVKGNNSHQTRGLTLFLLKMLITFIFHGIANSVIIL